jgi:hypothetical protein
VIPFTFPLPSYSPVATSNNMHNYFSLTGRFGDRVSYTQYIVLGFCSIQVLENLCPIEKVLLSVANVQFRGSLWGASG